MNKTFLQTGDRRAELTTCSEALELGDRKDGALLLGELLKCRQISLQLPQLNLRFPLHSRDNTLRLRSLLCRPVTKSPPSTCADPRPIHCVVWFT